jgi:hypothetical protein
MEALGSTAVAEQPANDGIDDSRFHGSVSYTAEDPKPADSTPAPITTDETKTQPKTDDRARNEQGQFVKKEEQKKDDKAEVKESKLPESMRPPKPKDPTDINARFHDLSRSHDELRRELQQARQELQALRQPKTEPTKTEPPKSYSGKPRPKDTDYDNYDAYVDALTDWKIEEREAARQQQQGQADAQRTYTEREQQFFTHAAPILAEVPNFEQIIRDPNLAMSEAMYHSIMHLGEMGPYTALYLAAHQDEAKQLYHLSPEATFLGVGRLAQRLEAELKQMAEQEQSAGAVNGKVPPTNGTTQPAPTKTRTIPDLKGSTPATGDLDQEPQDEDDITTWRMKEHNRMSKKYPGQKFFR